MNGKLRVLAQSLISELNESKGIKDVAPSEAEWWRQLDWKSPDSQTLFDSLGEETRELIIEAGLVKDDLVEEEYQGNAGYITLSERAKRFHSISDDDWNALTENEKLGYIFKLPPEKPLEGTTNKDEASTDEAEDSGDCEGCDDDDDEQDDEVTDDHEDDEAGSDTEELDVDDVSEIEKEDKPDPDEVLANFRRTQKDKDYPY